MAKAKAKTTDVQMFETPKSVAPVADWRQVAAESFKESARAIEAMPVGGGNWLSFRDNGTFMLGSEDVGNSIDIVILAHNTEFSYFDSPYVEGQKSSAACYSLNQQTPHPDSPRKQNADCATCEKMQMGSDERGRARACKVKGRIAFIFADDLSSMDSIMSAQIYYATPSTLNSIPLRNYLKGNDRPDSPIFAKRTQMSISAGGRAKYSLKFECTGAVTIEEALCALAARNIEARTEMQKARPMLEAGEGMAAKNDRKAAARKRKF